MLHYQTMWYKVVGKSGPPTYEKLLIKYTDVRRVLGDRRLTLTEKILYIHLDNIEEPLLMGTNNDRSIRSTANPHLKPDRVNMQHVAQAPPTMTLIRIEAYHCMRPRPRLLNPPCLLAVFSARL
jgi:hypothetical protein